LYCDVNITFVLICGLNLKDLLQCHYIK